MTTHEKLELMAYELIKKEVHRFDNGTNDRELVSYVRGITDLQTEIQKEDNRNKYLELLDMMSDTKFDRIRDIKGDN